MISSTVATNSVKPKTLATTYFSVGLPKLVLMSVCTSGLYDLYWFYKNWAHIKQQENSDIMPFWRAWFSPIFAYGCFNRIRDELEEHRISYSLQPGILAIFYFISYSLLYLPDPYWLLSNMSVLFLLPANVALIKINKVLESELTPNNRISGWNWLAVILGCLILIAAVMGSFLPVTA